MQRAPHSVAHTATTGTRTKHPASVRTGRPHSAGNLLGAAILVSRLVPAWIGWAAVVWNLACPAVLPIVSPGDPYYPILYAIPLLMISIPLIQPGRKAIHSVGVQKLAQQ
jgi:hypothetical protein